ncbi:hypothetical protein Q1695_003671 [Nippostrongylus brasiliensis]|nr:hypothetical protein Q1695_003671 [Nippostrongylus brasiliensis]
MSVGSGIELTYLEEPPYGWTTSATKNPQTSQKNGPAIDPEDSPEAKELNRSFKDHLPYFAGRTAHVKEVNMNCIPDYENNRPNYVVDVKWFEDDENSARRWQRLTSLSARKWKNSGDSSTSQLDAATSELRWESTEPTVDNWLGENDVQKDISPLLSSEDVGTLTSSQRGDEAESNWSDEESLSTETNLPPLDDLENKLYAPRQFTKSYEQPHQAPTEMLFIRIIIIEKGRSSIVRREIDYEAPSDEFVSSIYDILERNMPSLEKIQIYYTNRRIHRRTDLTKLPAGDRRQFYQLAGSRGSVIFVVAAPTVRIF